MIDGGYGKIKGGPSAFRTWAMKPKRPSRTARLPRRLPRLIGAEKEKGAPFPKRPSIDGGKPNSVPLIAGSDDHLSQPACASRPIPLGGGTVMRRNPRINGPAALPLFCLAPHGVFPASRIAPRAVSSYLAFSTLPTRIAATGRYIFCDTFRHRALTNAAPACSTRHAAVWCRTFLQRKLLRASDHLPSGGTYHIFRRWKDSSHKGSQRFLIEQSFVPVVDSV